MELDKVIIREMREEEIEQCAGVIRSGFATVAKVFGITKENCPTNGAFMKSERLRSDFEKGNLMYVLQKDNDIIGFMQLEKKQAEQFELEKLTVLPKYRHYGYGTMLLTFAGVRAKELGANRMTIGIIEENAVLKEWYQRNGFQHDGIKKFNHLPFVVGFMSQEI